METENEGNIDLKTPIAIWGPGSRDCCKLAFLWVIDIAFVLVAFTLWICTELYVATLIGRGVAMALVLVAVVLGYPYLRDWSRDYIDSLKGKDLIQWKM